MDCRTLPFSQLPHQPKLFLQFLDNFPKVAAFYAHPPAMQPVKSGARALKFPQDRRAETVSAFPPQNETFRACDSAELNFARFAQPSAAFVSLLQLPLFSV